MIRYPDSIAITVTEEPTQNASGYFSAGASAVYTFDCRAEINGAGRKIPGADGALIDFSFEVYMPPTTTIIPRDSDYVLETARNGTVTGKVKRASNGQLNSRLWL